MSRHHAQARCGARDVLVVAGYDRPLREVFLQVLTAHDGDRGAEEEVLYASVHEPWRDWTEVATVTGQLARLGFVVPDSLLKAVCLDQRNEAGNRVVEHHINRPPTVLAGWVTHRHGKEAPLTQGVVPNGRRPALILETHMQPADSRQAPLLPDNEIQQAAILLPDDTTIYGDPRHVAVAWTLHPSNEATVQMLGSQRRCLPFLARYEVVDLLCQDRAMRTVDGGLRVDGHSVTPENYLAQWRRTLGRPVSATQFASQFGIYAVAVFDAPLAPLRGQRSSWSSSPFERFDDLESRYASRVRYRAGRQAFELVLDLGEPTAPRDAFYLESFVFAADLGDSARIELQLGPTEDGAPARPVQPMLFADAA